MHYHPSDFNLNLSFKNNINNTIGDIIKSLPKAKKKEIKLLSKQFKILSIDRKPQYCDVFNNLLVRNDNIEIIIKYKARIDTTNRSEYNQLDNTFEWYLNI